MLFCLHRKLAPSEGQSIVIIITIALQYLMFRAKYYLATITSSLLDSGLSPTCVEHKYVSLHWIHQSDVV